MHAVLYETPHACADEGDLGSDKGVDCDLIPNRPRDELLSCDAIGCHGDYVFGEDRKGKPRNLFGSEGPSCFSCHGDEWSDD